jgi:hypothetical protein
MAARRALFAGAALLLAGCYDPGAGIEPPLNALYFPVGLATSAGATRLYVVNSDFDLQFNGGSLQALDLERIRALVPRRCSADADCAEDQVCDLQDSRWCVASSGSHAGKPCGPFGEKSAAARLLSPGRCGHVSITHPQDQGSALVKDAVGISAFATDVIYRARPTGPGGRLFVPTRGDATLHYIDTVDETEGGVDFELECGQRGNGNDCNDAHRVGDDPDEENTRDLRLPPEPFGIDALPDAGAVVLTHQTEGAASLFVNDAAAWGDGVTSLGQGPRLEFVVSGQNLPRRPIGVVAIPEPAVVAAENIDYQPGFLVTFRDAAEIHLLRFFDDQKAQPERPFLQTVGAVGITSNSVGVDSRGIAIDASERTACERGCAAAATECLATCAGIPLGVYVANRTPATLLIGRTRTNASATSSDDLPQFYSTRPVTFGPSRVIAGEVIDRAGARVPRIFLVCFDSRKILIFDPVMQRVEDWIETGRGPHAFTVDIGPNHAYGYIGHFTDSYIGVVDLDQRHETFGTIVLTVGKPTAPRTSK